MHWQRGLGQYAATVVEARPLRAAVNIDKEAVGDVETRLLRLRPDLTIRHEDFSPPSSSASLMGRPVYDGAAIALGGLWVSTLLLMIALPRPWRATQWAWFWLMWLPAPLGQLAYLLLSGPVPGTSPPRDGKRLTGGSGLLLAIALGFAVNVMIAVVSG